MTKPKFFIKLFTILVLVGALQFFLQMQFNLTDYAFRFPEKKWLENFIAKRTNVIMFGDSSALWSAKGDKDARTLAELLEGTLATQRISFGAISHPAYNLAVFQKLAAFTIARGGSPDLVVVPLNLRSFSPLWDLSPGWQFEVEKLILSHDADLLFRNLFRFLFSMKWYDAEPDYAANLRHELEITPQELVRQAADESHAATPEANSVLVEHFARCYMYPLRPDHRQLAALGDLIDLSKRNQLRLLFYTVPLNYQAAIKAIGPCFQKRVKDNITVLRNLVIPRGYDFLDLSFSVDDASFDAEGGLSTEHLKEAGRKQTAEALAPAIAQVIKKNKITE